MTRLNTDSADYNIRYNGFTALMTLVRKDKAMTSAQRLAILIMGGLADEHGIVRGTQGEIGDAMGLSRSRTHYVLRDLVNLGWLKKLKSTGHNGCVYRVILQGVEIPS